MDANKMFVFGTFTLIAVTISWVAALPKYDLSMNDDGMAVDTHDSINRGTVTRPKSIRPRKGCGGKQADVYFVIDSSDGVTKAEFRHRKQYAIRLVNMFALKKKQMRVGVVTFGRGPLESVRLGEHNSKSKLRAAIRKVPFIGGDRNTYAALYYLKNMAFDKSRKSAAHVAIILSNGYSSDYLRTSNEAFYAKKKGIYFYSVGTSGKMDKRELTAVASTPADDFVFDTDGDGIEKSLRDLLKVGQCPDQIEEILDQQSTQVCSARRPVDVVFGIENLSINLRNSLNIMSLLEEIFRLMNNKDDKIRVGVVTSRPPRFGKFSSSLSTVNKTLMAIGENRRRIPDLSELLRRVRRMAIKGAAGVQKTAVIFMDNNVPVTKKAIYETRRNKSLKIDTYVVFVGKKMSVEDIENISSGALGDYIIKASDYNELMKMPTQILKQICRGW